MQRKFESVEARIKESLSKLEEANSLNKSLKDEILNLKGSLNSEQNVNKTTAELYHEELSVKNQHKTDFIDLRK